MRLTTKIVLGVIGSVFVLSIGFIIGFSFTDRVDYNTGYKDIPFISEENVVGLDVSPYKTVWLDSEPRAYNYKEIYPRGRFKLAPVTSEEQRNKLFISEELSQFVDIVSSNDTLIIKLKINKLKEKYGKTDDEARKYYAALDGVNFSLYGNFADVLSNLDGVAIEIEDMETDLIRINSTSAMYVTNCKANVLEPIQRGGYNSFQLKDSQIKELNIDLSCIGHREIINSEIDVENLTGEGYNYLERSKKSAKVINWHPKNKDARLEIRVESGDSLQVKFK
ncbi:hypothetical protein [Bacteroides sp. 224]|uniref:hypothetical protein n=1 Tax=Bacteroides sp. 224 TaxID=2302936 RepID=UPI0013CF5E04|nr:hypothetical protein [Bacteroides sp. 224]NDV65971.1 hypothetical protein [Bacteroides sp. 224]